MIEPKAHDFIKFTRVIASGGRFRDDEVVRRGGSGSVIRVNKGKKKVRDGSVYATASVDCGGAVGIVNAVLDDAIIIGSQQQMEME